MINSVEDIDKLFERKDRVEVMQNSLVLEFLINNLLHKLLNVVFNVNISIPRVINECQKPTRPIEIDSPEV